MYYGLSPIDLLIPGCCLLTGFTSLRVCHLCTSQDQAIRNKPVWVVCQPMQEWWRMDDDAPWRSPENRPGPSPFKDCERPFSLLPAGDDPRNIKPDIVHTFHIGFGVDMAASIVVWLCKLGVFNDGQRQALDYKLRCAYSSFREFCHETHRFTACDQWCLKKFGMVTNLGKIWHNFVFVFIFVY